MIELKGIGKYFPSNGVMALERADFNIRSGEIHALLGENGTGKSTLMHILAGYFPASSGAVLVDGKERRFSAPAGALALGIGMVRQHPALVRGFKVWEDCVLGAETPERGSANAALRELKFYNPNSLKKRVEKLSRHWGFDLPLESRCETLTVSQRQKAAVLSLLLRDAKWLIFDEPTAVLTAGETEALFELFKNLRAEGRGIILITHKLEEALAISDRITVIRRGVTQESRYTKELSADALEEAIFETVDSVHITQRRENFCSGDPVLEIKDLHLAPRGLKRIKNINLCLRPGEICGITGVRDGGLETLELALTGLLRPGKGEQKIEGSVRLNGHYITGKGVRAFREAGGAYLGSDRLGVNLAAGLPLSESLIIHAFRRSRRGIFLNIKSLNDWCREIMSRAGIARSASDGVASFSGGMLQRILLAREFAEEASLIVLAEGGSGLDQSNRRKLEEELESHARRGAAVLLFSTDAAELSSIAGKIMLLKDGTLNEI
ncbi:MAG: ATP-binding cassette domain-containing protein [Treponema sp.]|nr:ATP-binding cassette domain-containing protein [Treponema sp.]